MCLLNKLFALLLFSSVVYPSYMPLDSDVSSGCLRYVEAGEDHIVGSVEERDESRSVFSYDFDFYLPQVNANSGDLRIELRRTGGVDTYDYCSGPLAVISQINGERAGVSSGNRGETFLYKGHEWDIYYVNIYPENPLRVGENSISIENMPGVDVKCTSADCLDLPYEKRGICEFNVCGFYPGLEIVAEAPLERIYSNESFTLGVSVVNEDDVDAGVVTIEVRDTDFDIGPKRTTQLIQNRAAAPFNRFEYVVTFTPREYVDLATGGGQVPKKIGTIAVTYTDTNGVERQFTEELGVVEVMALPPEAEEVAPTQSQLLGQEQEAYAEGEVCLLGASLLLFPLFAARTKR